MKLLGITGGVGMGKSTALSLLSDMGLAVIDTDVIARRIVEPGQPALLEVIDCFGKEIVDPEGRLRRDELARRVFANPTERRTLEAILHPRIRTIWLAEVETWRQEHRPAGSVAIPLLFETDASDAFDAILCISCSSVTQLERLRERGWNSDQIAERIQAQWPLEKKMASAHFVIWTEGLIQVHSQQLKRVLESLNQSGNPVRSKLKSEVA